MGHLDVHSRVGSGGAGVRAGSKETQTGVGCSLDLDVSSRRVMGMRRGSTGRGKFGRRGNASINAGFSDDDDRAFEAPPPILS
eukprot:15051955-Alexandrium_andersonii.AAC.1